MERQPLHIQEEDLVGIKNPTAFAIEQQEPEKSVWISSVFGLNGETRLPARFLSGFLPAFHLAERIGDASDGRISPTVRVLLPKHIGEFANGIANETSSTQIQTGIDQLTRLQQHHFPSVRFFIDTDEPLTERPFEKLNTIAQWLSENHDEDDLAKLQGNGLRRGGEQGSSLSLLYAAHHGPGWSTLYVPEVFQNVPPQVVINVMPPSEKMYSRVRETMRQHMKESGFAHLVLGGQRIDLTADISGRPHYLLIADETRGVLEPTTEDLQTHMCGELLKRMDEQFRQEKDPGLKDNLRRASRDFRRVIDILIDNKNVNLDELRFDDVLLRSV